MRLIDKEATKCPENYSAMLHRKIQYGSRKHECAIEICGRFTKPYRNVTRHHILRRFQQFDKTLLVTLLNTQISRWRPTTKSSCNFGPEADRHAISIATTMFPRVSVTTQYRLCSKLIKIYEKFKMAAGIFNMAAGFVAAILNFT